MNKFYQEFTNTFPDQKTNPSNKKKENQPYP